MRWRPPGPRLASPASTIASVSNARRSRIPNGVGRSSVLPCGCRLVIRQRPGEFNPAGDVELAEDLVQVVLDGAGTDEQPTRDLPVGQALGGQPGDLRLLRREHSRSPGAARAGPLAGGAQLGPGPARESRRAHLVEHLEGAAELVASVAAAALAAQPLPVHLMCPSQLRDEPAAP